MSGNPPILAFISALFWQIWFHRNQFIFVQFDGNIHMSICLSTLAVFQSWSELLGQGAALLSAEDLVQVTDS